MEDIIKLLPDALANQIAAGEVVQRPASVLKELMENSIDAQCRSIQVIVKEAGKTLIQVVDDGIGMSERDARMSFERHATSKIKSTKDLFHIMTMGFRGEALASIAAVAEVEMKTKRKSDDLGTKIIIEGSDFKSQEEVTCLSGTSIAVKNLFFNVPARKNFLKSNPVEMRHILDEFHKIALAHPDLEFSLYNNDMEVYHLEEGKLSKRIVDLFGKNYKQQLAFCEEDTPLIKIKGYIGKPESAKKSRGEQFFFINQRYIRHGYLHHAVMSAYEELIPKEHYPFYVLMIEIDPMHIDINVHPQKTEIKFDDEKSIYAIVQSAVRKALSANHLAPSLNFDFDVNFNIKAEHSKNTEKNTDNEFRMPSFNKESSREKNNRVNWSNLYDNLEKKAISQEQYQLSHEELMSQPNTLIIESSANEIRNTAPSLEDKLVFQIQCKYIVLNMNDIMYVFDQQGARERVLYDQLEKNMQAQKNYVQQLLFPLDIELNASDFQLISELEEGIRNLGFEFSVLEKERTIRLTGIPADAEEAEVNGFFESFLEQCSYFQANLQLDTNTMLIRSLSKRISAKTNKRYSTMEMRALLEQLFLSSNPNYTPSGKKIFVTLDKDQLDAVFQ